MFPVAFHFHLGKASGGKGFSQRSATQWAQPSKSYENRKLFLGYVLKLSIQQITNT